MSKPARLFQKPKPDATWAFCRLLHAIQPSKAATPTMATQRTIWKMTLRTRGSRRKGAAGAADASPVAMVVQPPPVIGACSALTHRRCVHDAALGPQRVEAAGDLERRALADVALERLAVVTDVLDDAVDPVLGQAELLAERVLHAEQAADFRVVR